MIILIALFLFQLQAQDFSLLQDLDSTSTKAASPKKEGDLLYCLGQEELFIHKENLARPIYLLNQELINLLSVSKDNEMSKPLYAKVCKNSSTFPSLEVIRAVLVDDVELFPKQKETIIDIQQEVFDIFLRHLTNLNAVFPNEKCNFDQNPKITEFMEQYYHFQAELGLSEFLKKKAPISLLLENVIASNLKQKECRVKSRPAEKIAGPLPTKAQSKSRSLRQ